MLHISTCALYYIATTNSLPLQENCFCNTYRPNTFTCKYSPTLYLTSLLYKGAVSPDIFILHVKMVPETDSFSSALSTATWCFLLSLIT